MGLLENSREAEEITLSSDDEGFKSINAMAGKQKRFRVTEFWYRPF